ncbi:MAG: hypothetical protein A2X46_12635 [Lentisphaerae bacterium GWF2_57_35]|nr:MAG: hypothetical protein A2X46_12635 [Lentisphaerae bacterium GWF2_57_35]
MDVSGDGEFIARCEELGVSAHGLNPRCALDALRLEIRYNLELCPCSSIEDKWIELEVKE